MQSHSTRLKEKVKYIHKFNATILLPPRPSSIYFKDKGEKSKFIQLHFRKKVFTTNSDALIPIYMQPNLVTGSYVVHLNFRAGSTFPVSVCTVSPGHWVNKADTQ